MTTFNGGEGLWYARGVVYFTTKGDKKVWAYTPRPQTIEVLYDRALAPDASLDAVDNVTVSAAGDVLVCEDGGNLEIGHHRPDTVVRRCCGSPARSTRARSSAASSSTPRARGCTSPRSARRSRRAPRSARSTRSRARSACPPAGVPADLVYGPPPARCGPPRRPAAAPPPPPPAAQPPPRRPSAATPRAAHQGRRRPRVARAGLLTRAPSARQGQRGRERRRRVRQPGSQAQGPGDAVARAVTARSRA